MQELLIVTMALRVMNTMFRYKMAYGITVQDYKQLYLTDNNFTQTKK